MPTIHILPEHRMHDPLLLVGHLPKVVAEFYTVDGDGVAFERGPRAIFDGLTNATAGDVYLTAKKWGNVGEGHGASVEAHFVRPSDVEVFLGIVRDIQRRAPDGAVIIRRPSTGAA